MQDILAKLLVVLKFLVAKIMVSIFGKKLLERNIWLITEKLPEARDNGYHLFVYLRSNHTSLPVYYAITKDSVDLDKIVQYGHIIKANSLKHYIYYICAKYSISSQPGGARPELRHIDRLISKFVRSNQHTIFLQHGITQSQLSSAFDYSKTGYSLFICASKREREFIQNIHGYPDSVMANIGFCRYDLLPTSGRPKKQILIMPTFRKWLLSHNLTKEATEQEKKDFSQSEYYHVYYELLSNPRLVHFLREKGYQLVFYMHYAMQPYVSCFQELSSDVVTVADRHYYDVQRLMIESALMVTDYSSVFFDFAYMEKPLAYFQFDVKQFQAEHYAKGYFDYVEDGFGPVIAKTDEVITYIIKSVETNCMMDKKYVDRVKCFFTWRDTENCKRTYEAIKKL